jgi:hypothetical protein
MPILNFLKTESLKPTLFMYSSRHSWNLAWTTPMWNYAPNICKLHTKQEARKKALRPQIFFEICRESENCRVMEQIALSWGDVGRQQQRSKDGAGGMQEEMERAWHGHHPRVTWGDRNERSPQICSGASWDFRWLSRGCKLDPPIREICGTISLHRNLKICLYFFTSLQIWCGFE